VSFHIKDDFKAGPVSQVPVSWYNAVAKFLNGLIGGFGIETKKSESGKSLIALKKDVLQQEIDNITQNLRISKDAGTPEDHADGNADDDQGGTTWTWAADGGNGLIITPYCEIENDQGWHYFGRCKLTYSKNGLLVKAEGLDGRKEIQG